MPLPLTLPTVHLNGTSRSALLEQVQAAHNAVEVAIDALVAAAPNGRDYYPQGPAAYSAAAAEHQSRLLRLNTVAKELSTLAEHLFDASSR